MKLNFSGSSYNVANDINKDNHSFLVLFVSLVFEFFQLLFNILLVYYLGTFETRKAYCVATNAKECTGAFIVFMFLLRNLQHRMKQID